MNITGWQIAIIALLIILLFGAPKLPKLAKSMGQSMRIFKSEVRTMNEEGKGEDREEEGDRPAVEGRIVEDPARGAERDAYKQRGDHR